MKTCLVCDRPMSVAWTDTHGVAQCLACGAPYRIIHYEGEGEGRHRVERDPEILLNEERLPTIRRCFTETKARMSAVGLQLSFPGGYDVASREDMEAIAAWWSRPSPPLTQDKSCLRCGHSSEMHRPETESVGGYCACLVIDSEGPCTCAGYKPEDHR